MPLLFAAKACGAGSRPAECAAEDNAAHHADPSGSSTSATGAECFLSAQSMPTGRRIPVLSSLLPVSELLLSALPEKLIAVFRFQTISENSSWKQSTSRCSMSSAKRRTLPGVIVTVGCLP
jgi:hypothetical protein